MKTLKERGGGTNLVLVEPGGDGLDGLLARMNHHLDGLVAHVAT